MFRYITFALIAGALFFTSCGSGSQSEDESEATGENITAGDDTRFVVSGEEVKNLSTPDLKNIVTDNEGMFQKADVAAIEKRVDAFTKRTGIPVHVLTVADQGDFGSFYSFADAASEKGCTNSEGLTFIISSKQGQVFMIPCMKTEQRFENDDLNFAADKILIEAFKSQQFSNGITNVLDYLDKKIKR